MTEPNARWRKKRDRKWRPGTLRWWNARIVELVDAVTGGIRTLSLRTHDVQVRSAGPRGGVVWKDIGDEET